MLRSNPLQCNHRNGRFYASMPNEDVRSTISRVPTTSLCAGLMLATNDQSALFQCTDHERKLRCYCCMPRCWCCLISHHLHLLVSSRYCNHSNRLEHFEKKEAKEVDRLLLTPEDFTVVIKNLPSRK